MNNILYFVYHSEVNYQWGWGGHYEPSGSFIYFCVPISRQLQIQSITNHVTSSQNNFLSSLASFSVFFSNKRLSQTEEKKSEKQFSETVLKKCKNSLKKSRKYC